MKDIPCAPVRSRTYSCTDIAALMTPSSKQRRTSMPHLIQEPPSSITRSLSFYNSPPDTPCYYHYPEQTLDSVRQQHASPKSRKSSEESLTGAEMPSWADIKSQYALVTQLLNVVADPITITLERKRALRLWTKKAMSAKTKSTENKI